MVDCTILNKYIYEKRMTEKKYTEQEKEEKIKRMLFEVPAKAVVVIRR